MSFFGGDTGLTYEDVQRKRKIADAMLAQNRRGSRNVGEGLGTIARALAARTIEKKTGAAMERLTAEADDLYSSLFGGGQSSGGGGSYTPPAPNPNQAIADEAMLAVGKEPISDNWENIQAGIFAGESGGDYDALFGYSQRPGGQFEGVKPTDMTVAEVAQFQSPQGDYGQWVKGKVGRVATPVGAYQVVGTTLRSAIDAGVVSPNEQFTPEVQDRVGKWVLSTQGTGAWEGYKGPRAGGTGSSSGSQPSVQQIAAALSNPIIQRDPGKVAVLEALLGKAMQEPDPMQALELERAQLEIEALRNPRPDAPRTIKLTRNDGSEVMAQWDWARQDWLPIDAPEGFGVGGPGNADLTEGQSKLTLFQTLMEGTAPALESLETIYDPANLPDAAARSVPIAGAFFESEEGKIYKSATAAWAEGALRIATGAAAQDQEIQRVQNTYFAQPGDTPMVLAWKRQMRNLYASAIQRALGNTQAQASLPDPLEFAAQYGAEWAPQLGPSGPAGGAGMTRDRALEVLGE